MILASDILILIVIILRSVCGKSTPRRMFVWFWIISITRRLLPIRGRGKYKIPVPVFQNNYEIKEMISGEKVVNGTISFVLLVWITGAIICLLLLLYRYYKEYTMLSPSLPCNLSTEDFINKVTTRHIEVRVSDQVVIPITFGLIKPVILIPKFMEHDNNMILKHVIIHETIHIVRRDNLLKLFTFVIGALNWFDPCVWMLRYFLAKDIEIACDEKVIRCIGKKERTEYVSSLYKMSDVNLKTFWLASQFGTNALLERSECIMKHRRSWLAILSAAVLIGLSTFGVFASSIDIAPKSVEDQRTNVKSQVLENAEAQPSVKPDKNIPDTQERYNLNREYRKWYPEITDEEALEIEKLHEYNRQFIFKHTGEVVEAPDR